MAEMEKTLAEIGQAVAAMRETHDREIKELREKGAADPVLKDKVDRITEKLNELDAVKAKLEEAQKLDARVSETEAEIELLRKGRRRDGAPMSADEQKHVEAFREWVRAPRDFEKQAALQAVSKTVSGASGATGGYAVPEVISRIIHEKLQDLSPVRQVCDVTPITTSDYRELVDVNGESYEWVAEGGTRSQQTEPQLAEVAPTLGTINAYYWANEEAIDDMFINVQSWLTMAAARAFARGEGAAFVSGNGTNKPTGFLNTTPSSAGDEDSPARAFGTLQYLPTGAAYAASAPFGDLSNTSPTFYPDNVFINAVAELKTGYQAGAVWIMNRATMGHVRKIRDADGRSMWQQSLAAGMPSTIMGFPVIEFPDMPDVGTNAFPVAFGNFREGYLFVERAGVRITMDEVTKPGAIKWNIRRRVGGKPRNDDAIKVIKLAAS